MPDPPKKTLATHLVAGGTAGFAEALSCHWLDTIKVRMQLRTRRAAAGLGSLARQKAAAASARKGFIATGVGIVQKEGFLALYKGLGAVTAGIVPKMAIRFSSFEFYKNALAESRWTRDRAADGSSPAMQNFVAGLGAGVTEAVLVVNMMEVIKIRLQAQYHSYRDPDAIVKYRNAVHCAYVVLREEGVGALYRGVMLTALRQATNQAANFTAYMELKKLLLAWQPERQELPSYQHLLIGGISGAMGPLSNAPIDTIKTRLQRMPNVTGESAWERVRGVVTSTIRNDGYRAFYKGITPRLLRVAPGQAVTFMVYERVRRWLDRLRVGDASLAQVREPSQA